VHVLWPAELRRRYVAGKVFVVQLNARLIALDAQTGQVAWTVQVDDPRAGYLQTMAPRFWNRMVFIGISGAEYEIRVHVTAYDANTGGQSMWQPPALDPGPGHAGHRRRHVHGDIDVQTNRKA
jgi:glucose dehydrogenase